MDHEPTVFVVDEDMVASEALRKLAYTMSLRCRVFHSSLEFLAAFDATLPGCLVTEWRLSGTSGLQVQQRLAAEGCPLPVIILTAYATIPIAVRAMRAGAFHFLEKPLHEQEAWDVIQAAVALDAERRRTVHLERQIVDQLALLTPKEEQVLRMIAEGLPNRDIAHQLQISVRTVELRRTTMLRKLQLASADQLIHFAVMACHAGGRHAPPSRHQVRGNGFSHAGARVPV